MINLLPGNRFLVVSKAAELSSYHSDYLTQLCRKKQLLCRRISKVWFVDFSSLDNYLKQNAKSWIKPYNELSVNFIEIIEDFSGKLSIFIDGIEYINSTQASHISSYNRDYLTQLARSGEIQAKKMGKVWFFSLPSLQKHINMNRAHIKEQIKSIGYKIDSHAIMCRNTLNNSFKVVGKHINHAKYEYEAEQGFEELPLVADKYKKNTPVSINKLSKSARGMKIHNYIPDKKPESNYKTRQLKIKSLLNKVNKGFEYAQQTDMEQVITKSESKHAVKTPIQGEIGHAERKIIAHKSKKFIVGAQKKYNPRFSGSVYNHISIDYSRIDNRESYKITKKRRAGFISLSEKLIGKAPRKQLQEDNVYFNLGFESFTYAISFALIFLSLFFLLLYNLMYYGILDAPVRVISV